MKKYRAKAKHFGYEIFSLFKKNSKNLEAVYPDWLEVVDAGIATIVPSYQEKDIVSTYERLQNEMNMVILTTYFLFWEMLGADNKISALQGKGRKDMFRGKVDFEKCYYHIDNFYHRSYVLEEMTYRLVSKLFLHTGYKPTDTKEQILTKLENFGYSDAAKLLKDFTNNKYIKDARTRRRHLIHRTGYSAEELFTELMSVDDIISTNSPKQHRKQSTKRAMDAKTRSFCVDELEKMLTLTKIYQEFVLSLQKVIRRWITEAEW